MPCGAHSTVNEILTKQFWFVLAIIPANFIILVQNLRLLEKITYILAVITDGNRFGSIVVVCPVRDTVPGGTLPIAVYSDVGLVYWSLWGSV